MNETATQSLCNMQVLGVGINDPEFGVNVYSGGGQARVDWIEAY
jgi:hypothetical protein